MDFLLLAAFKHIVLGFSLFFISFFLIFIVLIQRGRGGGLSGALGGTGQSAFGSRAGDEMTYITLIVSAIWIFLCVLCIWVLNPMDSDRLINNDDIQQTSDDDSTGLNTGTGVSPGATPDEDPPSTEPAADLTPDSPAADDTPSTEPAADLTPDSPAADDTPSATESTGSDGLDDPGTNPSEQPAPGEPTGDKPDPVEPGSSPESPAQP
jgi:preprotein translocase subunit SecG